MGDKSGPSSQSLNLATYSTRQKSVVWKYFYVKKNRSGVTQRDKRVTCSLYTQKIAHGGGTTNLKNHLKTNHWKEYEELFENEDNQTLLDNFVQLSDVKKLLHNSTQAVELTNAVVEFVARDLRPVSVVMDLDF